MANQKSSPPVFLLAFANDARASLGLGSEQNAIWNELRGLDEKGVIQCQPISATLNQLSIEFSEFNDQIYVFHYGGHSDNEFLHLLDTSSHAENFGVQIGQQKNLKLVFLNGCRNFEQVEILHKLGVPVVIATTTHIKDEPAILLAKIFYRNLKGGSTIGESFERAKAYLFDTHPELKESYRGIGLPWDSEEDSSSWGIYPIHDSNLSWSIHDIETESRQELLSQLREASKTRHQKFIAPGGRFHHLRIDDAILTGIQDARRSDDGLIENNIALEGTPTPLFQSMTILWEKPCPHAMLVGPGGMGKTVSLLRLWEHLANAQDAETPVPIFIQLNEFNNEPVADFIQKYIRKHYADVELDTLLKAEGQNHPSIILLLDGINEVTAQSNELLLEINRLKVRENYPGLQLILTSRVDMRDSHQWQDFHLLELLPLTNEQISTYLKGKPPSEPQLLELLRNPMMLSIYAAQSGLQEQYRPKGLLKEHVTSTGELLFNVEAMQRIKIEDQYATSLPEQAFRRFVLEHLLPFISWEMQQAGQFFIQKKSDKKGSSGLEDLLQRGISSLLTDAFFDTFEFYGEHLEEKRFEEKPRLLFSEIINQVAVQNLVVLVRDGENYRFLHQNFRDYFAARHVQNQIRLALYQKTFPVEMVKAPLDFYVRHLLGELEGEHTNKMDYDENKGWHWSAGQFFLENNISSLLENCRGVFNRNRLDYIVWNILTLLKEQRSDFSGANLYNLDLNLFSFRHLTASRPRIPAKFMLGAVNPGSFLPQGYSGNIEKVAFHPTGSMIIIGYNNTVKVWNVNSGQHVLTISENCVGFHPNGSKIITASNGNTIKVWDLFSEKNILTLRGFSNPIHSAVLHPDGSKIIATSIKGPPKQWDVISGKCISVFNGHGGWIRSVALHPDGSKIITASDDNTAKIWDAISSQCILTLNGHTSILNSAAFNPDGAKIITASGDNTAKIWDAISGQCILTLKGHEGPVIYAAFHPDGSKVITTSFDNTSKIWDTISGECLFSIFGYCAAFHPDGSKIITASFDNTTKVWDAISGSCLLTLNFSSAKICSISLNPDGSKIITASHDNTVKVWDTISRKCVLILQEHTGPVRSATFHPDGSKIITASDDGTSKVWDAISGQCILTLYYHSDSAWNTSFSPDGTKIITAFDNSIGSGNIIVKIWDIISGQYILTLRGQSSGICNAKFSPNGAQIITAFNNYTLSKDSITPKVWDTSSGKCILTLNGHSAGVWSAEFSPDGGRIVSASDDSTAKIWDATSGQCILTLKGHSAYVWSAAFNPDGDKIITSSGDRTAKVWDAISGQCILTLQGHSAEVWRSTFSPDGHQIFTASDDGTSRVWDARTGECLHVLPNVPGLFIQGCDFRNLHPDSKFSEEDIAIMRQYGGIFNDEDARQWEELMERHFGVKPKGGNKD